MRLEPLPSNFGAVATDLDLDGDLDLAVTNFASDTVSILLSRAAD